MKFPVSLDHFLLPPSPLRTLWSYSEWALKQLYYFNLSTFFFTLSFLTSSFWDKKFQFLDACAEGKYEVVKSMLQSHKTNVNIQDENNFGNTPLFQASYFGHIKVVELLLSDKRTQINKVQNNGGSSFYIACQQGHLEIVKLFLKVPHLQINQTTNDAATPFYIACQQGHAEIVKLLLKDPRVEINKARYDVTPFYIACLNGHIEVVNLLLSDIRTDTLRERATGGTPFYVACQNGHLDVVKHLLADDRRVNINQQWQNRLTPLDIAKQRCTSVEKFEWETDEEFKKVKENCPFIVELIEQYLKNPERIKMRLKNELKLPSKIFFHFLFFPQ